MGSFTLNDVKLEKRFKGSLPIEDGDWQIGVIVGRSGSGKTSIAKQMFPDGYITGFQYTHQCIIDEFPESLETSEITRMLCSVGFASPPDWLKSYIASAKAKKCALILALALSLPQKTVVFDEFTSVVDREIAKVASYAISKAFDAKKTRNS